MAYNVPKIVLTSKKQGTRPAICPQCGRAHVVLYLATDVAKCQVCGRVWHPSDLFYLARRATSSTAGVAEKTT